MIHGTARRALSGWGLYEDTTGHAETSIGLVAGTTLGTSKVGWRRSRLERSTQHFSLEKHRMNDSGIIRAEK